MANLQVYSREVQRIESERRRLLCMSYTQGTRCMQSQGGVLDHAVANDLLQTGDDNTRGDKDLKNKPAEKEAHGNNNLVQAGDKNANGSINSAQAEDSEWPFDVVNNDIVPTAQATPRAEVYQGSPSMLRQPIAMETPTKSPMPPYSTRSPMTPRSDNICYGCGEKGHWIRDCPKPKPSPRNDGCFHCGMAGHWRSNCTQLHGSQKRVVN